MSGSWYTARGLSAALRRLFTTSQPSCSLVVPYRYMWRCACMPIQLAAEYAWYARSSLDAPSSPAGGPPGMPRPRWRRRTTGGLRHHRATQHCDAAVHEHVARTACRDRFARVEHRPEHAADARTALAGPHGVDAERCADVVERRLAPRREPADVGHREPRVGDRFARGRFGERQPADAGAPTDVGDADPRDDAVPFPDVAHDASVGGVNPTGR